jgi:hypothetical protein
MPGAGVSKPNKRANWFWATRILCALAVAWAAAHYFPLTRFTSRSPKQAAVQREVKDRVSSSASPFGHPYYRYSVIPGGAYTREELEKALARDRVAAKHYAGFDITGAYPVTLDRERFSYVSYRVGEKIYWTSRPIRLRKGETLLTDGSHFVRTRCGNRLVDSPPERSSAENQPDDNLFDAPVSVNTAWSPKTSEPEAAPSLRFEIAANRIEGLPESLQNLTALAQSVSAPPAYANDPRNTAITRDYIPTPHEHEKPPIFATDGPLDASILPVFFPSETPPVSGVPEPGTAALGGIALIGIALIGRLWRKRHP